MATWSTKEQRWQRTAKERPIAARDPERVPVALHVELAPRRPVVTVYMEDELDLVFLAELVPGLAGQPLEALRKVELDRKGEVISWPGLGVRLSVDRLAVYGPEAAVLSEPPVVKKPRVPRAPRPAQPARSVHVAEPAEPASPTANKRRPAGTVAGTATATLAPTARKLEGVAILHGAWVPGPEGAFAQDGQFHVWVEGVGSPAAPLDSAALRAFLDATLGPAAPARPRQAATATWLLPTAGDRPLPSPEAARWLDLVPPASAKLEPWTLPTHTLPDPIETLAALRQAALERPIEIQLGADLIFWSRFTHALKAAILKDQYIPALRLQKTSKGAKAHHAVWPTWQFVSPALDAETRRLAAVMPPVCRAAQPAGALQFGLAEAEPLLRHMAALTLTERLTHLALPQTVLGRLEGTLLAMCVKPATEPQPACELATYQAWRDWRDRLSAAHTAPAFDLGFQLLEPESEQAPWTLAFLAISRVDPSLRVLLADYWALTGKARSPLRAPFGDSFEREVLLLLGQAARMVPGLWAGLETDKPAGLSLTLAEAHGFLKTDAWLLEDAGFKVLVPAWWTPAGRKRVRARLLPVAPGKKATPKAAGPGQDGWLNFRYELAIGDAAVTDAEWRMLVNAKTPLVRFRGEWVELDPAQMARVQALVEEGGDRPQALSALELVRIAAEADSGDLALGEGLSELVTQLTDPRTLTPVPPPQGLNAQLREYQERGLAWLTFLDALGMNGCLADDMGLGKTMQVIARLVHEREQGDKTGPTLLVAPTSVVGNWLKEMTRFAPSLRVLIHHGAGRVDTLAQFSAQATSHDVVITSYALVRRDQALFTGIDWHRVVLDEAQNIKNPAATQTRVIRKLKARHRLALTGTPVENRLLDLWSLFDFLNPGYLGKEAAFRKSFETPIQRDADAGRAELLRRLTAPLILRRVKTDPAIIRDLPEKVEQKLYCPLTPEQASLYEAVVKEAEDAVDTATGIQRKGMMLATLMKLKQVCNHPAQLLQDGSAFTPERSHKLERLTDHAREILSQGESLLVFTQFAELGAQLARFLQHALGAEVPFLHGGTSREARERMIDAFQSPDSPPAIFVLSLKAGGVGITLTRANHVFHFDRWWNPAVEEQATDRAFRIGQKRNVFVHKFVTLGTLEERIDAMLEDKRKLAAAVVGTDESWLANLDNEAFKQLIALDRASVMA